MTVITHLWWSRGRCTQRAATRWGTLWTWWWWFDYADADDNDDADDENDDADDDDDMMMMMKSTFSGSLCRWGWRDSRARPPAQPIIIIIIILISKCVADPDKTWLNLLLWWLCRRSWQDRPPNIQPSPPPPPPTQDSLIFRTTLPSVLGSLHRGHHNSRHHRCSPSQPPNKQIEF